MAKIKRELKKKTVVDKISHSSPIATACGESDKLGDITTQLAAFVAAIAALNNAASDATRARAEAQSLTGIQNRAEQEWNDAFEMLCRAIESNTKGDAQKIMTAGLHVYERGHMPKLGRLPAPGNLVSKTGAFEGTVILTWEKVRGGSVFVIQTGTDPGNESAWSYAGTATRCKFTVKGLESGKKYWFRVAAVGAAGQGPWSDPALCMAA